MSHTIRYLLAKNIEKLRNSKKLNREELSLALGFDNSYISKLEREKMNVSIDKLEQLAKYFKVPVKNLFE